MTINKRLSDDMLRQRRNLIIASCLIWFFHFGNVTVTSITYSDIDFNIGSRNSVYIALWVFYTYSVLRFFVYFMEEGLAEFKNSFVLVFSDVCQDSLTRKLDLKCNFTVSEMKLTKKGFSFQTYGAELENNELVVSYIMMIPVLIKTIFIFLFFRTAITDYLFPFMLAVFVFLDSGLSDWNGSILKIIISK